MPQNCSAGNKAVVMVNPGDTATIVSLQSGSSQSIILRGNYIVIDGLRSATAASTAGEYVAMIIGNHNAFLNVEIRPAVIPSFYYGVGLFGDHNLLYRSYLHDFGSPDAVQNPGGNGGWILEVAGAGAVNNVIWSNHLTRGGARRELLYGRVQLQSLAEQCYGWRLGPGLGSCFCGRRGV